MMKTQTLHIVGSIRWLFIYNLPIYFLFLSFLLSGQVGNGVVYVSTSTTLSGSQHINVSDEEIEKPNAITFVGGAEMVDFSGDLTKEPVKIQAKASPQKKVFNIQKEAKKKIAKKLIAPKIINVAEINSTKQDTFFYSNGVNKSFACSTVSQYSFKKAIVNSSFEVIALTEYQDDFFIDFHSFFLISEVNNTSAFIRPPPAFLDAFTSRSI